MEDALELIDVHKSLGGRPVVGGLSLVVKRGEFFSLLGPSGCGKSTTLRLIAGFERPDRGVVRIRGRAANGVPPYVREVNIVFQHYALFPHMTVWENVAFGLEMLRTPAHEAAERVSGMLRLVRLDGLGRRYPRELSGGQQQRVALARALVTRPEVVLLDEPLGALDLKLRKEMQAELKELQESLGITFVYVTHDQEEALTMSDRIAVMHEGRVLQVGTPEEVYERPMCRFVADFIGRTNFLEGRFASADESGAVFDVGGLPVRAAAPLRALTVASQVVLAIRPERMHVGPSLVGAENRCDGVVEDMVYFGADRLYRVRLDNAARVLVRQQNGSGWSPRRGERVQVGWSADAVNVVEGVV